MIEDMKVYDWTGDRAPRLWLLLARIEKDRKEREREAGLRRLLRWLFN